MGMTDESSGSTASEISARLKAPFADVKTRLANPKQPEGPQNPRLPYITSRQVMDRLDEVVGPDGWSDRYFMRDGKVCCSLEVCYGDWVEKSDGAGDTNIEGDKGAFADAFKRAAVKHGIGRYLYPDAQQPGTQRIGEHNVLVPTEEPVDWDEVDHYRQLIEAALGPECVELYDSGRLKTILWEKIDRRGVDGLGQNIGALPDSTAMAINKQLLPWQRTIFMKLRKERQA